ncbi:uncharacterized protein N0V89_004107 [Didymosphaeria variabile]|uniref:Uncharacterized protein n=1 Tax=Didymosphaeria variabile TaxID=1932322 RepID=A0A9W9CCV8_9PLEO|nr:uncharacterized protein N0V89_004107 [Didymosphaeria variabile]KAJ4356080.1 hypothetical protein N0V89_004107 [Didymosphaeria variabile]
MQDYRYGIWVYGKDTGMAALLGSMCHDYGLPEELGDPAKTIPISCELVHMGCVVSKALVDASRSSAFLGAFIALFYYGSRKQLEILFFVLPRAAATWFPRRYLPEHQWKEHYTFALSAAIVLTAAQDDSERVRGVLGSILNAILRTD